MQPSHNARLTARRRLFGSAATALLERAGQVLARARIEGQRARRSPSLSRRGPLDSSAPEPRGRAASARWLVPAALIAAVVAVTTLALGESADKGQARHAVARRHARSITPTARATRPGSAPRQPVLSTPPSQVSPALAAQLEARGHELLQADEPQSAVPVLKEALAATGESLDSCVEPASETCLTYAYALYDLGTSASARPPAGRGRADPRTAPADRQPAVDSAGRAPTGSPRSGPPTGGQIDGWLTRAPGTELREVSGRRAAARDEPPRAHALGSRLQMPARDHLRAE